MTLTGRRPLTKPRRGRAGVVESSNSGIDAQLRALIAPLVAAEVKRQLAEAKRPVEWLSTGEAAELARVTQRTIRRWISAGKLVPVHAGRELRVKRGDLERFMAAGGQVPDADRELTDAEVEAMAAGG